MFCRNCGAEIDDSFKYCRNCGAQAQDKNVNTYSDAVSNGYFRSNQKTPSEVLAGREQISAIVWTVIASLQGIIAVSLLGTLEWFGELIDMDLGYSTLPLLGLAIFNGYGAYCSFQRVKRVRLHQRGIVSEYDKTLTTSIIGIVANVLLGSVFGIAGAIFDLFNRNYALSNADYLEE